MRARVTWFEPDLGGKKSGPPVAGEYRPNALFLEPKPLTAEFPEVEFGSVRFLLVTDDSSDVELDFWSPRDLSRYIYGDSPFLVMEGRRPVGFARMYEESQNPN